jgi:hypothetical protein
MTGRRCRTCGGSLDGRRGGIVFCGDRCRKRAHRARAASPPLKGADLLIHPTSASVTPRGARVTVTRGCLDDSDLALSLAGALA